MTVTSTAGTGDTDPEEEFVRKLQGFAAKRSASVRRVADKARSAGFPVTRPYIQNVMSGSTLPTAERLHWILQAIAACDDTQDQDLDLQDWVTALTEARASRKAKGASSPNYAYIQPSGNVVIGAQNNSIGAVTVFGSVVATASDFNPDHATAYLEELESEIATITLGARRRLFAYRALRFTVLAASAVTPALALLQAAPWVTATVGAIAFLTEGAIQLTRLNDRAVLDSRRVSMLSREFRMYRTRVGDYSINDNFAPFVQRIEAIREENDNERLNVVQLSFGANTSSADRREISQ